MRLTILSAKNLDTEHIITPEPPTLNNIDDAIANISLTNIIISLLFSLKLIIRAAL